MTKTLLRLSSATLFLLGGCMSPESTETTQVALEAQRVDLDSARANRDEAVTVWAGLYRKAKVDAMQAQFAARLAAAEGSEAVMQEVAWRDAAIAALDAEISGAVAKLKSDDTLDAAIAANELALDYISEVSERDRRLDKVRRLAGLKAREAETK